MNFTALIRQISKRLPDKTAIIENNEHISYRKLWDTIEKLSQAFHAVGLTDNNKVIILLPNCREFIYAFFALLKNKTIAVPLNPKLTAYELATIFKTIQPEAVISTASLINQLHTANPLFFKNVKLITIDADVVAEYPRAQAFTFKRLLSTAVKKPLAFPNTANREIASINFTYRGYGYPLGAILTHGNYLHGAVGYIRLIKPDLDQRFLLVMPMSHIFTLVGCVLVPLLRGATVVIMRNLIPSHVFKAIEEYKIDFLVGVPTFYHALLSNYKPDKYDISSLKHAISGADYLSPELVQEIENKLKVEVLQGYGLTETLPIICNPKSKTKPQSLGIPGHEVKVKIVDDNGQSQKPGEIGEILIHSPTVMKGYYNHPKETSEVFKDGWLHTGDLGRLDKEGYLYFEGLKKDIVKVGGNTIDLNEIKKTLLLHQAVAEAYIYPKPSVLWGKILEAEVFVKQGLTEKDLKTHCSNYLAPYKIPAKIKVANI